MPNEYRMKSLKDKGYSERDAVLIDMKRSKNDKSHEPKAYDNDKPEYPWGLEVTLDNESLDKLGIDELKDVGEYCEIRAVAKVKSVSERAMMDEEPERNMCLQIMKMSVADYDMDDMTSEE